MTNTYNNKQHINKFIKDICGIKGVSISKYTLQDKILEIYCAYKCKRAYCPSCHKKSKQVRSSYTRKLLSLPLGVNKTKIYLKTRRFKCNNSNCSRKIFSEQNSDICTKYSRITTTAKEQLQKIAIELSSIKGSYLLSVLNMPYSSSSCLRLIHKMPFHQYDIPKCIGIDDWAKKEGQSYGTIIVNSETGKAIDLINSRKTEDIISPLAVFKDTEYVTRDRARFYSKAITTSIPNAKQIADKFHLVKNLSDAISDEIKLSYSSIRNNYISSFTVKEDAGNQPVVNKDVADNKPIELPLPEKASRMKLIFNEVKELQSKGMSNRGIARKFGISRTTVRRFSRMECYAHQKRMPIYYNNYEAYLEIIQSGVNKHLTKTEILKEMRKNGFDGKYSAFIHWMRLKFPNYKSTSSLEKHEFTAEEEAKAKITRISAKVLSIHICNPEYGICKKTGLVSNNNILCDEILKSNFKDLFPMRDIYMKFRALLKSSDSSGLDAWINSAIESGIKGIVSFAKGLLNYREEIENAIDYKWTNGVVEGNVNRLKNKKREMYGRASFDLLRKKVCMSVSG